MRGRFPLVVALLVLIASPGAGEPTYDAAIREAVQRYVAAFNAGDAEGAAANYTPDGSHTYALGLTHHGRGEIARGLKELFAGPMNGARISISTLDVRLLAPTVAVEEESFVLEGMRSPDGQALPALKGLCLAVHQKQREGWLAAAVQCLIPPANPGQR